MEDLTVLLYTAAILGFVHTISGPDHYIPFITISKANNWTIKKTISITLVCGLGHILSSALIGVLGIIFGYSLIQLEFFESVRGSFAGWVLISFGLIYFLWGVKKIIRGKPHTHYHYHSNGIVHKHEHSHLKEHLHIHSSKDKNRITPWALFLIFVFGPCEVLIPLMMYPTLQNNVSGIFLVVFIFSLATLLTMMVVVVSFLFGIKNIRNKIVEKYSHAAAGIVITICGCLIKFAGL